MSCHNPPYGSSRIEGKLISSTGGPISCLLCGGTGWMPGLFSHGCMPGVYHQGPPRPCLCDTKPDDLIIGGPTSFPGPVSITAGPSQFIVEYNEVVLDDGPTLYEVDPETWLRKKREYRASKLKRGKTPEKTWAKVKVDYDLARPAGPEDHRGRT